MNISIPELSLVILIGPSGCGKSTFAKKHFKNTEIISSDFCRGILADDENDQTVTKEAFELLHQIVATRLKLGRLAVVDATNVQPSSRKSLIQIARQFHCLPVAIVFKTPEKVCYQRNELRPDRDFGNHVIRNQMSQMKRGLRGLKREGFMGIHYVDTSDESVDELQFEREPLWNNKKAVHGPFDIIGDIHGCYDEFVELCEELGYAVSEGDRPVLSHQEGRTAVFVGDIVDRGPKVVECLELVMNSVEAGTAYCVPGNHDDKLKRKLGGRNVQLKHGLAETIEQLKTKGEAFAVRVHGFIDSLVSHLVFDDGKLVVAHAGLTEEMHGRGSGKVRAFALYGETTGETDEFGLPVRGNWAAEYKGRAKVVYGHTPVPEAEWFNNTINLDTGCVFGGKLTALRYPELEVLSVEAREVYAAPAKPFLDGGDAKELSLQQNHDSLLHFEDVGGKRFIDTRLSRGVTIREEHSAAAIESMSRFSVDPRWLIYLPPTMSPCETSALNTYLEHPDEAFGYFKNRGVPKVICEEKHMGSRAVVVVCKDEEAARNRFGVKDGSIGCIYTRTGRPFFDDRTMERALLERVQAAVSKSGLLNELDTDWLCLDCELMPWSWKARELLTSQYAATGVAAEQFAGVAASQLREASQRVDGLDLLLDSFEGKLDSAKRFKDAYRHYCWTAESVDDLKLAPFHLLASEKKVHVDRSNEWHMQMAHRICREDDDVLLATRFQIVDTIEQSSLEAGRDWWLDLTENGGEGMVIKPLDFVSRDSKGLLQPAVKCRGPEYLRIIYGMEYLEQNNLDRLKSRNLRFKRSLALREFALGVEALERFVRKEPLRRVHECVFGVLALESEPVDPRL